MKNTPIVLIAFRLLLGPVMIWLTYSYGNSVRILLVVLLLLGILSDIFDGIIARITGTSSQSCDGWTAKPTWCFGYV